jgi:hypothetical protein
MLNFAREIFYIGLLSVPERHPRDVWIIIIKFTSISGHVKFCPRNFLYRSAKHPEMPSARYMYYYN